MRFSVRRPIDEDGPTVDLVIGHGRLAVGGRRGPESPPDRTVTIRGPIDTGAGLAAIDPRVLAGLDVGFDQFVEIARPGVPGGGRRASLHDVAISIRGASGQTGWIRTTVAGVRPATPSVLAIIGRDVLQLGTLLYDGPAGEFTLSF